MPGLAIILSSAGRDANESDLNRMVSTMRHEPFYTSGTYVDEDLGVYAGWVNLPGSYAASLPLRSANGNQLLFFHGEHLANGEANGLTDARAVLRLFETLGLEALPRLNGWFHGLLVDVRMREAVVFNDRYGMQRLHVYHDPAGAVFAAEAKALLAVRPQLRKLDPQSVGEFLSCGCVLENRSLFAGLGTLPAGSVRQYSRGSLTKQYQYFDRARWESQPPMQAPEFHAAVCEALPRAVERCLGTTELSVAVSLTGGYDTRLVMACLNRSRQVLPSYTFGGMYRECFDVKIARKVAQLCGCKHQVFELGQSFLNSFPSLAEKTVNLSDGCLGVTNAYELYLNQFARQVATVRLTGSYGSEVMRGARAFKAVWPASGLIHPDFQPQLASAVERFGGATPGHSVSFSVFKQAPWYYYNRLAIEQSQVVIRTPFMDNDFVGLFYRRPAVLNDSRALARSVIARLAPELAALPTDTGNSSYWRQQWSQFLFKADYCYKSGMPQWLEQVHYFLGPFQPEKLVIGAHRFAHSRVWFRNELAPYVREILLDSRTTGRGYFNRSFIEEMVRRHIKGDRNYTDDIERALTLELTCRRFLDA